MKRCYALHPAFYTSLKQEICIHTLLEKIGKEQKDKILILVDIETLLDSAEAFFERHILRKGDCLYYENALKAAVYKIQITDAIVYIDDYENPFYQLLIRKYRCLVVEEVEK